jgi:hypothetical protein
VLYFKPANEIAARWAEVGEKGAFQQAKRRYTLQATTNTQHGMLGCGW